MDTNAKDVKPKDSVLEEIQAKSGWDMEKVKEEAERAKKLGISFKKYLQHECWSLNEEALQELGAKLKRREETRKANIKTITEATGWDEDKVKDALKAARKIGFNSTQYVRYRCWELMEEQMVALLEEKAKKEKQKKNRKERIEKISQLTGWDVERIKAELAKATSYGITSVQYMRYECWQMTDDELSVLKEELENKSTRKAMKKTGISKVEELKILKEKLEKRAARRAAKKKRIGKICAATGWSEEKAEEELKRVSELGIKPVPYVRYECWNMSDEEIVALKERLEKREALRAAKKARIEKICAATGWSEEKAEEELKRVSELGIKPIPYVRYECWNMSDEEIVALKEKLEKRAALKAAKKARIEKICIATAWSEEKAEEELKRVSEMGIKPAQYVRYECWNMSDEEIVALKERLEKRAALKAAKKERIAKICAATDWSEEKAEEELERARELGIKPVQYVRYECWKMRDEELIALKTRLEKRATLKAVKKERIEKICAATGWSKEKAEEELKNASAVGVNNLRYVHYECWNSTPEEIEALGESLRLRKELREKRIKTVCEATGWSVEDTKAAMKNALHLGISNAKYVRYGCWQLTEHELQEFGNVQKELKAKKDKDNAFYVESVQKATGWSEEKVKHEMEKSALLGVSPIKYVQKAFYERSELGKQAMAAFLKSDKSRLKENKNIYIDKICEVTGWEKGKAELEVAKAKLNCGASYEDYYAFKLYDKTPEEQREYVTYGYFSKMRIKYNDHFIAARIFDDKAEFNRTFTDCINRKWFVNRDLSYEEFLEKIDGLDAVLVKPLAATQGIGISKVACNVPDEEKPALYELIMNQPHSIVEQYIVQHEDVMAFCPTSVNTLRITTLNANGKCNLLYAVFRMGRGAVVDNFHAGGIAGAVDLETGVVITDAVDLDGNVYPVNPYSGLKIKGFQIPNWDKIVETCQKTYNRVEHVNLIGWDFAITPEGVDLIEGNPGASYVVAQIPYVPLRKGLMSTMVVPYL